MQREHYPGYLQQDLKWTQASCLEHIFSYLVFNSWKFKKWLSDDFYQDT